MKDNKKPTVANNAATPKQLVRTRKFFKLLPLIAAVLFATSWSKFDGGNTDTVNEKRAGSISYAKTYVGKNVGDASFSNPLTLVGDGKVVYTSDNTDVATVDADGNVTIVAAGKATITATVSEDTDGFTYADANTGVFTVVVAPEDCIPGIFSVSKDKKVYFSKGNLQCNVKPKPGEKLWRFAEHQYDKCLNNKNWNVGENYRSYKGKYIDLFGWGTWLDSPDVESPTATHGECKRYIWKGTPVIGSVWETLSGGEDENAEWYYLLRCRESATNKCGRGTVAGVFGMILLPDDWTFPNNLSEKSTPAVGFKSYREEWSSIYTAEDWAKMEANGAVFLPGEGRLNPDGYINTNGSRDFVDGCYWSSSPDTISFPDDDCLVWCLTFDIYGSVIPATSLRNDACCSVRLVRPL